MEMVDKRKEILANEELHNALTKLTVPAVVGTLTGALYSLIDTIFVGKIGTESIAAVTIVATLMMMLSIVGTSLGVGAASSISRLMGEKKEEEANVIASVAYITTVILLILASLIANVFIKDIVTILGASENIIKETISYGRILMYGSVFLVGNICLNNLLRAECSLRKSMVGIIVGSVLNIILDPVFIFVFKMGITGAALASVISQLITTVILLGTYVIKRSKLTISFKYFKPSKEVYCKIMSIGYISIITQIIISIAMWIMNTKAISYGEEVLASIGVVTRIIVLALSILWGFQQGFQPIAGYCYGAKKHTRLVEAIKINLKRTTMVGITLTVVYAVFSKQVIYLFTSEPEIIKLASLTLKFYTIFLPFLGAAFIINTLFSSIGRGGIAAILSASRQGVFFIIALLLLPERFGLTGLLMSQVTADGLYVLLCTLMSIFIIKQIKEMKETKEAKEA